jgi:two-component system chemotaxis sensor kinase CheA
MIKPQTESLLQEIATEMAFLTPGQAQHLKPLTDLLSLLAQDGAAQALPQARSDLDWSLNLCRQALSQHSGLSPSEINDLQSKFERLSNALYMGPSEASPTPETVVMLSTPLSEEASFTLGANDDLDFLNEFCNEGRDLLQQIEQGVLALEENPQRKDTLNQVFRAFHTFKGGAGFMGIAPIQRLAHELESLLDAARQDKLRINREVIDIILAGSDALQHYVNAIDRQIKGEGRGQAIVVPTAALLVRAQACLNGDPQAPQTPQVPQVPPVSTAHAPEPVPSPSAPPPSGHEAKDTGQTAPLPDKSSRRPDPLAAFVKLDTCKLDALVELMGELVIAQSMVVKHPSVQAPKDRELERHLRQLTRITTDLQHNAMSLRMVPLRSVMQKMGRLVRDLSTAQNKSIQLHLSGEDTELDRKIVEELADPLLHMMLNAVDHGIETPAQRMAAGKTAQGNIHLQASHQGGGILICIRDDGKGLDAVKILHTAHQRGLIPLGSEPSEKDVYNLIFLPGFSTADKVTKISGRGVGMDVVRGSINKLRGRVDIDSVPGQGTTFNIFLPLTLAIIDAMLVGVGTERFLVPTLTIRESLRPQPDMVFTVQGSEEVIRVRGKLIPLIRLSDKLGVPCQAHNPCDGIVVVVDLGDRQSALLVDRLIGKHEVVIKSLGNTFRHQQGMSGAAILGDGRVSLIIDPVAMGQLPSMVAPAV